MKNLRSPKIEMCNKKKLNEDDYILTREDETAILDIREKRGIKRHEGQEDDSGCLGTVRLVSSVSPQLVGCYGFDACLGKPFYKLVKCLMKKYYCVLSFHIFYQIQNWVCFERKQRIRVSHIIIS